MRIFSLFQVLKFLILSGLSQQTAMLRVLRVFCIEMGRSIFIFSPDVVLRREFVVERVFKINTPVEFVKCQYKKNFES